VKPIVEAHEGEVSVESALGSGTAFTIALPMRAAHALVSSTTPLEAALRSPAE
jgi:signal transduction histidine kinase